MKFLQTKLPLVCMALALSSCGSEDPSNGENMEGRHKTAEKAREVGKCQLVGKWASVVSLTRGPTHIRIVTIEEDGTFRLIEIEPVPAPGITMPGEDEDGPEYAPVDAVLSLHETGRIDFVSGQQKVTSDQKELSVKSISWSVVDGKPQRRADMGTMGSDTIYFRPVD